MKRSRAKKVRLHLWLDQWLLIRQMPAIQVPQRVLDAMLASPDYEKGETP